jgi:2-oxoisovalerate dehydrogenase E2 component (dihydrolipoyl transacylase)
MARFEFKLPDVGEGIAEAELVEWLVAVGDAVKEDQPVAAVMTDKATVELEAPVGGIVMELGGATGDTIRVGTLLVAIDTEGGVNGGAQDEPLREPISKPMSKPTTVPAAPAPNDAPVKVLASPAVRRRAREFGIDLAGVPHDGATVDHRDLDAFLSQARRPEAAPAHSKLVDEEVRVIGMRRIIARNMEEATREIPHFTYVEEIDMTEFERLRTELGGRTAKGRMSVLSLMAAAICRTLPEFPKFNAHYQKDGQTLRLFGSVHLGIATQSRSGLIVPVVRGADQLDIWQLDQAIAARVEAARSGKIDAENLRGATITLTSLGKLGGIAATPIVMPPQVCILGPNKIAERPVIRDGAVSARKIMNLSISCDHRIIDGHDAASFVQALKLRLETPALIFLPAQN